VVLAAVALVLQVVEVTQLMEQQTQAAVAVVLQGLAEIQAQAAQA
jgi:hypothetical protein